MEASHHPDWSGIPEDLIALVMRVLDIPDLLRVSSVCASWRAAVSPVRRVRIPITNASPCLLYSCAADEADTATIYSPSSGWILAADEESNLQALNQLTGAQVDLPPVTGLYHVESCFDDQGRPAYNLGDDPDVPDGKDIYIPLELRLYLYHRVYLSCSPSAGAECVVLLLHKHYGKMSFARVGDDRWTRISWKEHNERFPYSAGCRAAAFSKKDGVFYVLFGNDSEWIGGEGSNYIPTRTVSPARFAARCTMRAARIKCIDDNLRLHLQIECLRGDGMMVFADGSHPTSSSVLAPSSAFVVLRGAGEVGGAGAVWPEEAAAVL
ncbi:hypothetical protein PR202_gb13026 [Eleusine coracana subsp. coracana]|uniref:F-box domain-containing protein n=1 Tax=Eleusine coracana subsp. coracana TaxID=191504 RepID=A0AAV5ERM9_ELECO|nr:hypothetical protein PR202_gb13026 [Eleusine coracana subsp. coracana]